MRNEKVCTLQKGYKIHIYHLSWPKKVICHSLSNELIKSNTNKLINVKDILKYGVHTITT